MQEPQWGKLTYENIEIKSIKPTKIGLLPLVRVIDTPIGNAFWTTKKISFNNQTNFTEYVDYRQKLILPEGAGEGQHWTNWFKSAIGTMIGLGSLGIAIHSLLKSHPITAIISLVISIAGVVWDILSNTLSSNPKSLYPPKIFENIRNAKKIYNKIMKNNFNLQNFPEISWSNLNRDYFSTYIDGILYGKAWSTAIFGQYSRMNLYTAWGAMNADIKYLVYKN